MTCAIKFAKIQTVSTATNLSVTWKIIRAQNVKRRYKNCTANTKGGTDTIQKGITSVVLENLFSLTDFSSFLLFKAFDNNAWDRYLRVISHVSSRIRTRNWHNSVAYPDRGGGKNFFSVSSKNKGPPWPLSCKYKQDEQASRDSASLSTNPNMRGQEP